jgi:hypothetical protein
MRFGSRNSVSTIASSDRRCWEDGSVCASEGDDGVERRDIVSMIWARIFDVQTIEDVGKMVVFVCQGDDRE